MAAAASGCYSEHIENGFVVTSSCKVYNSNNIYCRYYCHDGYVKTASTVYCAGNDKWIPTGSHPSHNTPPCRKDTDPVSGCENIFFENGYVVTCPVSDSGTIRDCMYKCNKGYKPASSSVHCVRNEWVTSDSYSDPCIKDGSETTIMTRRSTVSPFTSQHTTYPGYYDDPNLRMEVSPVIFVGAVIGGLIILGLLIFAIFFRAHKKTIREARVRSAFIAACDPLSLQNDYTNNNNDTQVDDSEFRDIARRIMSQSSNQEHQTSSSPPPYEEHSPDTNHTNRSNFNGPPASPFSSILSPESGNPNILNNSTAPPYSEVFDSGNGFQALDCIHTQHVNCSNAFNQNRTRDTRASTDKPPPYEVLQNQMTDENVSHLYEKDAADEQAHGDSFDPPPPYTT